MRYGLAVLASVAALVLRGLLNPLLGRDNPYHTVWLAVVWSAWYCGVGPSIVATLLTVFGVWYWFIPPYHSFALQDRSQMFGLLAFAIFSAVVILLGESTRSVVRILKQTEDGLRKTQEDLENRVRDRTAELERKTAEVLEKAASLDLVNDAIFVRSIHDIITYWNRGAERLYGWTPSEAIGRGPHELLHTEFPIPLDEIRSRDNWEGELLHTKRDGKQIVVASRWTTLRDDDGQPVGSLEINTDITARRAAEEAARRLSGRILSVQDDERRRIARELHDSLGQYLTALKINVDLLASKNGHRASLAAECSDIVDKCLAETRTISHLLHPPLLDEAGLVSAVRWYVDGFDQRSGIRVSLDLPPTLRRLDEDAEIAVFRALQETLTNVHRHSGGSAVNIHLGLHDDQVRLEVEDNGNGIPAERLRRIREGSAEAGVGIAGMRERVHELGGSLEIQSSEAGTKVIVSIPLAKSSAADSLQDAGANRPVSAA